MEESQNFTEPSRTRNFKTWKLEEKKYLKNQDIKKGMLPYVAKAVKSDFMRMKLDNHLVKEI